MVANKGPNKDLYGVLGLSRAASQDDIRRAFRRLAREHHPDANPEDSRAEERFKEIQQAYEVLSNPEKRREHDQRYYVSSARNPGGSSAGAMNNPEGSTIFPGKLSDLLGKLGDLSDGGTRARGSRGRELRSEDIARMAKLLGVNLNRISELLGDNVKTSVNFSFGDARLGEPSTEDQDAAGEKPPKPPIPPKTRKPDNSR
ncbi:MAG: DnaJ domain-containing protein [Actinobacteria bacterium]|nr:DnaJ domain-containing protein [Actinomycetota bacterium]MCA1738485.1 DnaJ domain-containing protein [Actinomycetota bacterium]